MGKSNKQNRRRYSYFYIVVLLVKFCLIKIGQIPLVPTTVVWKFLRKSLPKHKWFPGKAKRAILIIIVIPLLFWIYLFSINKVSQILPSPYLLRPSDKPLSSELYDRNGQLIYRFYDGVNRSVVKIDNLPPYVWEASIAIEDKNFFRHPGFDPEALVRASWLDLSTGSLQGGSTITQQLVKNTLLTPDKTINRKLKEIALAFWAERIYSKNQILEMYLNESPYGGPTWGIETASLTFFGKHAKDLSLAEATYLAALPASPSQYSPYGSNPDLGLKRQKEVLKSMTNLGYITPQQAANAASTPLLFKPLDNDIKAPHFVMYIRDLLREEYGNKMLYEGGLKITTSLDLRLQNNLESIVKDEVGKLSYLNVQNGAAMVTDPRTGQVLAMVGSKDYSNPSFGNYNATLALRQPGSSIKVVTYATAFKQGFTPGNSVLDLPVSFPDGINKYTPVNYDGRFHGPVSIRTALGSSYNIPAVKMLATVGIDNMIQTAKDMGITTFNDRSRYGLSLTLGGGEVKMVDMMAVYGTLSQMGTYRPINPIVKITDSFGNVLEEPQDQSKPALAPEVAYLITNVLSDDSARTPAFGNHSLLYIPDHEVAVKTGTSDNKRDNWTFGYTPDYVVGVWVGNNDNTPMNPALTSGITGAAPIWNRIVHSLLDGQPNLAFQRPAGIIEANIDGRKDLAIGGQKPKNLVQIFNKDSQYVFVDPFSSFATPSASTQPTHN